MSKQDPAAPFGAAYLESIEAGLHGGSVDPSYGRPRGTVVDLSNVVSVVVYPPDL